MSGSVCITGGAGFIGSHIAEAHLAAGWTVTCIDDLSRGKRPGFDDAMKPPESERLYLKFCERLAALSGRPLKTGKFGASMVVSLKNDGPATFWISL